MQAGPLHSIQPALQEHAPWYERGNRKKVSCHIYRGVVCAPFCRTHASEDTGVDFTSDKGEGDNKEKHAANKKKKS